MDIILNLLLHLKMYVSDLGINETVCTTSPYQLQPSLNYNFKLNLVKYIYSRTNDSLASSKTRDQKIFFWRTIFISYTSEENIFEKKLEVMYLKGGFRINLKHSRPLHSTFPSTSSYRYVPYIIKKNIRIEWIRWRLWFGSNIKAWINSWIKKVWQQTKLLFTAREFC